MLIMLIMLIMLTPTLGHFLWWAKGEDCGNKSQPPTLRQVIKSAQGVDCYKKNSATHHETILRISTSQNKSQLLILAQCYTCSHVTFQRGLHSTELVKELVHWPTDRCMLKAINQQNVGVHFTRVVWFLSVSLKSNAGKMLVRGDKKFMNPFQWHFTPYWEVFYLFDGYQPMARDNGAVSRGWVGETHHLERKPEEPANQRDTREPWAVVGCRIRSNDIIGSSFISCHYSLTWQFNRSPESNWSKLSQKSCRKTPQTYRSRENPIIT